MEVYRAVKSKNVEAIEREMKRLNQFTNVFMRGPFMEEFGYGGKDFHIFMMEFPRMLERTLIRTLEKKKDPSPARRKSQKSQQESEAGE